MEKSDLLDLLINLKRENLHYEDAYNTIVQYLDKVRDEAYRQGQIAQLKEDMELIRSVHNVHTSCLICQNLKVILDALQEKLKELEK